MNSSTVPPGHYICIFLLIDNTLYFLPIMIGSQFNVLKQVCYCMKHIPSHNYETSVVSKHTSLSLPKHTSFLTLNFIQYRSIHFLCILPILTWKNSQPNHYSLATIRNYPLNLTNSPLKDV